jgi:hypothetical protein
MARLGWAGGLTPPPLSDDTMPERRSLAPRGLVPQGAKPGEGVPARFEHHEVRLDGVRGAPGPGRPADAGDASPGSDRDQELRLRQQGETPFGMRNKEKYSDKHQELFRRALAKAIRPTYP